ncbi:MAG: nicotinate (nicotinamide) nucleotide adenylyltransferase [Bdellovibrionaceae bacterium]|nr:nicotinate (nicotinamide) nucleotide adenylyltransferase [Pseudobdellovibrionaceae bacterium]MBX3033597.1 nicotinate (nicotinamide) nucleotide adenylyltransferase [Pseudobdellovibrionaceae bacterium]
MKRIGIFGGSFNPPHMGHVNSLQTVLKKMGLDRIHVVPSNQNPLKVQVEGPTPQQREEMIRLAMSSYGDAFFIDDREIRRGGVSYTIDTLKEFRKDHAAENLFLIIGADNLESFHEWKDYKKILTEANLIVTTRPGFEIPTSVEEMPEFLRDLVEEADFNFIELKTGRSVQFLTLSDVEVSSSDIRKKLRSGRPVQKELPLSVESYIKEQGLYRPLGDRIGDYRKFVDFCANVLFERKGINVRGFDLRPTTSPTEFALVASGTSTRHASALAENVIARVKEEYNVHPQGVEGMDEGRWVVIDYGSLIVHLFYDFVRHEYALENLWKDGKDLGLKDPHPA